ncbi:hypothetical protein HBI59_115730 [Parastagonospora nodorum]|nr:hypothetical protein HBI59_115730 [Parastagonospora nodorum]
MKHKRTPQFFLHLLTIVSRRLMAHDNKTQSHFSDLFKKQWPSEFHLSRKPVDDRPCLHGLLETLRGMGEEFYADDCQLFMESYDDDLTSFDVENAIRFIQAVKSRSLQDQSRTGKKGTAWLDDRTCNRSEAQQGLPIASIPTIGHFKACNTHAPVPSTTSMMPSQLQGLDSIGQRERDITDAGVLDSPSDQQAARSYPAPLTAHQLHDYLREKQFDHETLMDADRRLIHVADPDAYDFLALIKTARQHQHHSLREAICKYLSLETSIKASINEGYSEYHMEFHIPYFAMRRSRPEHDFDGRRKRGHRGWMNIAFLDARETASSSEEVCGVHQAQISVTICGTDNLRWTAFCFEDRSFDEDSEMGNDEQTDFHQSDQLAKGSFGGEDTIWDAREYFLRVLLIRMRHVLKEWVELVRLIDSGIKQHSWGRLFFSPKRDGTPTPTNDRNASTWIDPTMQLLGRIIEELAKTNESWMLFTSETGDFAFFSDEQGSARITRTFNHLTDVFRELSKIEKRLQRMAEDCERRAQTINLRLTSDSKKSAELTVYFISPFAIVSTFFAIPTSIMGFDRNIVSFLVALSLCVIVLQAMWHILDGTLTRKTWWLNLVKRGSPASTKTNESGALQRRNTQSGAV